MPETSSSQGLKGRKGGLGRGLGALIPAPPVGGNAISDVAIDLIDPNPFQPRQAMDPDLLETLTSSIRLHGVIQPLVVSPSPNGRWTLIAGERRWRAARRAGLAMVPIVSKDAAPQAMLELALIENVVRADLSPLEEAAAYRRLIDDFGLTQAVVAERVGRSRVSVTNTLRLLAAPEPIQSALSAGDISEGHARALLGLSSAADQIALLDIIVHRQLTVRQTEEAVRRWMSNPNNETASGPALKDRIDTRLEDRFQAALGTKVSFRRSRSGGGSLTIHYYSDEELDHFYRRVIGDEDW
jgi:ParB family chromosome partitioning protein